MRPYPVLAFAVLALSACGQSPETEQKEPAQAAEPAQQQAIGERGADVAGADDDDTSWRSDGRRHARECVNRPIMQGPIRHRTHPPVRRCPGIPLAPIMGTPPRRIGGSSTTCPSFADCPAPAGRPTSIRARPREDAGNF